MTCLSYHFFNCYSWKVYELLDISRIIYSFVLLTILRQNSHLKHLVKFDDFPYYNSNNKLYIIACVEFTGLRGYQPSCRN